MPILSNTAVKDVMFRSAKAIKVYLGTKLVWESVNDQGLAKDYSGTGWYKATDTGVVYNKDVPAGETYIFDGDPIEYISVWQNDGFTPETFRGTLEDTQKLIYWHNNLHRYATSNVTDMSYWVYAYDNSDAYGQIGISPDDVNTDALSISHYDTSSVTSMEFMFALAPKFDQPLDNFDTSKVTNMVNMFAMATSFNQGISSWNTSKVTDMYGMFSGASSFNGNISTWDTSKVISMNDMFNGATSFNQDLSGWCVPFTETSPYDFDNNTPNWTLPKPIWGYCPRGEDGSEPTPVPTEQRLAKDYSGTGWYKATDTGTVFCKDIPEGETQIFPDDPKEYISVYTKTDAKKYADRAATSNITDMSSMFSGGTSFNEDISHWDVSNVTTMSNMFNNATSFNGDISSWDTSNVINMSSMFYRAISFNQDISSWNISKVANISSMFSGASSFNGNISTWNTSNVTNMSSMFSSATSFNQDISKWNTSKATNMSSMFSSATSFNQDISKWNTSKVTTMRSMFNGATSFNQDLSKWCVSKITSSPSDFDNGATNWTLPKPVWGTCPR